MPKYTKQQLPKVISYARKNSRVPRRQSAALYEVNIMTLNWRLAETQLSHSAVRQNDQLFFSGEERAIVDHCGVMADLGFPLSYELLKKIA